MLRWHTSDVRAASRAGPSSSCPQPGPCLRVACRTGHVAAAAAAPPSSSDAPNSSTSGKALSKRQQQLLSMGLEDGWGVLSTGTPSSSSSATPAHAQPSTSAPAASQPAKQAKKPKAVRKAEAIASQAERAPGQQAPLKRGQKAAGANATRSPFVDLRSEQGMLGLALLQHRLRAGGDGPMSAEDVRAVKAAAAAASAAQQAAKTGVAGGAAKKGKVVYVDDDDNIIGEEEEDEDITDVASPAFSLTIGEEGTEFAEYDKAGNVTRKAATQLGDLEDADAGEEEESDDEDGMDFSGGAWDKLSKGAAKAPRARKGPAAGAADSDDEEEEEEVDLNTGAPLSTREMEALLGGEGISGVGKLLGGKEQAEEEDDWGLAELGGGRASQEGTLMETLGVVQSKKGRKKHGPRLGEGVAEGDPLEGTLWADGANVTWGGSGSRGNDVEATTGVDLSEQEALLLRMFKPHKVAKLMAHQREALQASIDLKRLNSTRGAFGSEAKTHEKLRIIAGSAANKRLTSSQGSTTRPMMEKVRAAIFNMILAQAGSGSELPQGCRWLDLFAGTGSVGLEALSRGAGTVHFVEADNWVVRNVLGANIKTCGFNKKSVVHTAKVEEFLKKAIELPRFAGGAFDFISMCPPYLLVSYPELFELMQKASLIHDKTIMFVEYPKQLAHQVPDQLGPLEKVRDRKYGRTWIAVYAPRVDGDDDGLEGLGLMVGSE